MSGREAEIDGGKPLDAVPEPGWRDRLASATRTARALFATRAAIFREELAEKGALFRKAAVGLSLAALFGALALLLLTALVAALFARLFGGPIAGITVALVLYLLVAGGAGYFGWRSLSRVRPFDFPVTRDEIRRDLDAVREEEDDEEEDEAMETSDLEERFRAGSE